MTDKLLNQIQKSARSAAEATRVQAQLLESFPFLRPREETIELWAHWSEFYIGVLDDSVDPDTYDSFCLLPLEELYWRTDWQETGLFGIASFFIEGIQTEICVSTGNDPQLYLLLYGEESHPQVCGKSLGQILTEVEAHAQTLKTYLATLFDSDGNRQL